jgi:hypothetical protein
MGLPFSRFLAEGCFEAIEMKNRSPSPGDQKIAIYGGLLARERVDSTRAGSRGVGDAASSRKRAKWPGSAVPPMVVWTKRKLQA